MLTPLEVTAPSRLHFGMFSFGQPESRQFGGVGVMIDRPGLRLRMTPANEFETQGPLSERVTPVVRRLSQRWNATELPACRIEILTAPPEHAGLGTGTQLELAVTAGLNAFLGFSPLDAVALARLSGRGLRSAIGTHGFVRGGLLVESGKLPGEILSPLEAQVILPAEWRFVLLSPKSTSGLAGEEEQQAFRSLPPVPLEITSRLRSEVTQKLLPAAHEGNLARFGESLYRFGHLAGLCFAASQGGPFASPRIEELVQRIRSLGIHGVGQSSWGPTLFALVGSQHEAEQFCETIAPHLRPGETSLISPLAQHGASISPIAASSST